MPDKSKKYKGKINNLVPNFLYISLIFVLVLTQKNAIFWFLHILNLYFSPYNLILFYILDHNFYFASVIIYFDTKQKNSVKFKDQNEKYCKYRNQNKMIGD